MGGIVIDIWEKSNFFGSFGSQKGAQKRNFCSGGALKAPPYGRVNAMIFACIIFFSITGGGESGPYMEFSIIYLWLWKFFFNFFSETRPFFENFL